VNGSCLSFDGNDDYVDVPTDPAFNLRYELTIEAWINPDTLSTTHQNSIVDHGNSYWFYISTGQKLSFLRFKNGAYTAISTDATILTGTWTHVVATYNSSASDQVKLYINGHLSKTGSLNGPIDSVTSPILIGDRGDLHHFDGTIDEVAIYNKPLTPQKIRQDYYQGILNHAGYCASPLPDSDGDGTPDIVDSCNNPDAPTDMVSYWSLDDLIGGCVFDSYGAKHGSVYGAVSADGMVNDALSFDGVNDYVEVPDDPSLNIRDKITIEAWVNPDSLSTVNQNSIVDRGNSYWFFISKDKRLCFLRFNVNDPETGYGRFSILATDTTVPTGTWTHVAATYDTSAGNEVRLYINGQLSRRGSFTNGLIDSVNSPLNIGDRGGMHYFDGTVDEVAIYHRSLTSREIDEHYYTGLAGKHYCDFVYVPDTDGDGVPDSTDACYNPDAPSGLVSCWGFEESSGMTVVDSYGLNPGSLYGTTFAESSVTGKLNHALSFDGINDYINVPNDPGFNLCNELTIEAWINPDTLSTTHQNSIVDRGNSYWLFVSTDKKLSFLRFRSGTYDALATDATIPTRTWTHVAVTYDSSTPDEVNLYINGHLSKTGSLDGPIDSISNPLTIGDRGRLHYFDGVIDNVAIYNRALNEAEIQDLYRPSAPQNLTSGAGDGYVRLSWSPPLDDGGIPIIEYKVYRGNGSGNETFLIAVNDSTACYNDTFVTNGETYYYYVDALNEMAASKPCEEVSATPGDS
jgi:hypothetical protein